MPSDFYPPALIRPDLRGDWYEFEIRLAQGPPALGSVGDGSFSHLYGCVWLAAADRASDRVRIYRAVKDGQPVRYDSGTTDADWEEVASIPLLHPISEIRHLAFAFDKSAQPVLAYEHSDQVWVRQYDPLTANFIYRGPFPGRDPVLLPDSVVGYFPPDADIHLYHLSPNRLTLIGRYERQLYATPHTIRTFSQEVTLDMALPAPYQIQLLGSYLSSLDATGYVVRSMLYPVYLGDSTPILSGLSPAAAWDYVPLVIVRTLPHIPPDALPPSSLTPASGWAYVPIVITYQSSDTEEGVVIGDSATDVWIGDPATNTAIGTEGQGIFASLLIASAWSYASIVMSLVLPPDNLPAQNLTHAADWRYQLIVVVINTTTDPGYPGRDNIPTQSLALAANWAYEPA